MLEILNYIDGLWLPRGLDGTSVAIRLTAACSAGLRRREPRMRSSLRRGAPSTERCGANLAQLCIPASINQGLERARVE